MRAGKDFCLLANGVLLPIALQVADQFALEGTTAEVISFPTVKPLDETALRRVFAAHTLVATLEEHSVLGGFGGSVAEWLADHPHPEARLVRFGTPDMFYHDIGDQDEARAHFGLTADAISSTLRRSLTVACST